jgi:hypothetical protein
MKSTGTKIDDVLRKNIPMVNLPAAYAALADETTPVEPAKPVEQKVSIGTFNGYIAIYTQGYEGSRMTAKVAGRWLAVDPIRNVPGKSYSLVKRNTGPGVLIKVVIYIDGELKKEAELLTR